MSYAKMAQVYDILMEDAPYDQWLEFTKIMFAKYGREIIDIADLGCGTGQITRRLADSGFNVIGVDNSTDMLTYAEQAADREKLSIQWVHQDLRKLDGFNELDAVVSFCDVINYIVDIEEVEVVFKNVNQMLKTNGLFIFDVHSINHVEHDLKGKTFAEIYDDISYVWMCEEGENEGEVFHDLTFFVLDGDHYQRFDERHHQRTYYEDFYKDLLKRQGFFIHGLYADFSSVKNKSTRDSERLFFVCEKM
ncbi:methyltransferase domain-containing protein [Aquibacillus halophilus]|uniref:Methyltransferase domain-containing protein n=1 Tax=Aquibacillus halophilus TaxID=930132 RepID=A0A6A8DBQ3_9BACI|nr:class I SAM-dependent methyltransferase [Aquibacillus halophilus]MRH43058.1 methyltransferase domain-containing protein [Aquibacillus halophilus]